MVGHVVGADNHRGRRAVGQHALRRGQRAEVGDGLRVPAGHPVRERHRVDPPKVVGEEDAVPHDGVHLIASDRVAPLGVVYLVENPPHMAILRVQGAHGLVHGRGVPPPAEVVRRGVAGHYHQALVRDQRVRVGRRGLRDLVAPQLLPCAHVDGKGHATCVDGVGRAVVEGQVPWRLSRRRELPAGGSGLVDGVDPAGGAHDVGVELAVQHRRGVENLGERCLLVALGDPVRLLPDPQGLGEVEGAGEGGRARVVEVVALCWREGRGGGRCATGTRAAGAVLRGADRRHSGRGQQRTQSEGRHRQAASGRWR
mmetsp:Transcript_125776/g.391683  ORF Transcript_125776/g.391683 Transcript_125776/m.391683 type:complete len:312 (+) Transcript_125776:677-1612(+)